MRKKKKEMIRKPIMVSEAQARGFKEWRGPTLHPNRIFTPSRDRSKDQENMTERQKNAEHLRVAIAQKKAAVRKTGWKPSGKRPFADYGIQQAKRGLRKLVGRRK